MVRGTLAYGGYAPGIIVRGGSAFKGGLGYFFPIRYTRPPSASDVEHLNAKQAILISWFGGRNLDVWFQG